MMIWVVGFVLFIMIGLLLVPLVLAIVAAIVAAIAAAVVEFVVRVALGGLLAAAVGIFAAVISHHAGWDGALTGGLVSLLTFIPALLFIGRLRSSSQPRKVGLHSHDAARPALTLLDPYSRAWATARRLAPRAGLATSELACARVIELTKSEGALDLEVIDLATTLCRHVPALVEETEELLTTAGRSGRRIAVDELVADLIRLGEQASELTARKEQGVRERLAVRRARLFGTKEEF